MNSTFSIDHHHHPVPCFIALAIMSFHIPRSLVAFRISTTLPAPSDLTSPSVIFSRCFPLLRFPSIIPVVMRCSNSSLLITWPKNVVCCVRILFTSALDVWASFSTVSFDFLAIHDIFIILLRNHISTASSFFCACLDIVSALIPLLILNFFSHWSGMQRV